jgi:methylenetetrahydrofolate--tRNA-(uracil-5-)-methyltransferase
MKNRVVSIVGAGLSGCEAALFLSSHGIKVELYEMKPEKKSPVHASDNLAEIVCSNSFGSVIPTKAPGVLKEELKLLGSPLLKIAHSCSVPAGHSLTVDRERFSAIVTQKIRESKVGGNEKSDET